MKRPTHAVAIHHRNHEKCLVNGRPSIHDNFINRGFGVQENGAHQCSQVGSGSVQPFDLGCLETNHGIKTHSNPVAKIATLGVIAAGDVPNVNRAAGVPEPEYRPMPSIPGEYSPHRQNHCLALKGARLMQDGHFHSILPCIKPLMTSLIVPSPPAAMTNGQPFSAACCAKFKA